MKLKIPVLIILYATIPSSHTVSSTYYSPCNLARFLYKFMKENSLLLGGNENAAKYMEDIPLLVCIAGYHGYNANFSYTTRDKVRHVGLFGLAENDAPKDRRVESHSMKFLRDILRIQGTPWKNRNTFDFYESLCNVPHLAINVRCHIDSYVFGSFPVIVPKDLDYLYNYYQAKDSYWTPLDRNNSR
ncbi:hypothetical protein GE061_001580 [Apolygus lucorum]|uniref:Uncharacterized protein n=1 Tax=Apolygus lucorum TaxID=248454 RepID=A0A6A4K279_APOLU|nr:hypothetical protein GE061_001580 [Apolygus lucorum]